jgi:DNA-binding response OmpR family regulator
MPRILIAEDDEDVAGLLAEALTAEGYEAERAADFGSALAAAGRADLVVLDLGLPGAAPSPARVLREKAGGRPAIVILTGRELSREDRRGELDGADAALVKGCSLDELLDAVRRALESRRR